METIEVDAGELEGWSIGAGEPVLMIHGSLVADALRCLERQPVLAESYRLVGYHRRGFSGSADHCGPFTIAEQAADAAAVLRHFGIDLAHVVGHSYGGAIALQLALDCPGVVGSLAVLEPGISVGPAAAEFADQVAPVAAAWRYGDKRGAAGGFLELVGGPAWREAIDATVGGQWFDQVVADIDVLFAVELVAARGWRFGVEEAGCLNAPFFAVCGDASIEFFQEGFRWLQHQVEGLQTLRVADATHLLQMQQPAAIAAGLASFLSRQRLHG